MCVKIPVFNRHLSGFDRRWICFPWRIEYLILRNPRMFQKTCLCHGEPVGICKCLGSSGHKSDSSIGLREIIVVGPRAILHTNKILISGMVYTDIRVASVPMTPYDVLFSYLVSYPRNVQKILIYSNSAKLLWLYPVA